MTRQLGRCPAGHRLTSHAVKASCATCGAEAALAGAAALVAERIEVLSPEQAAAYVAGIAARRMKRAALVEHLESHPDAFVSESSDCPPVVVDLLRVLVDDGIEGVRLPRCVRCGRSQRFLANTTEGGRLCCSCGLQARPEPCERCGRTMPVGRRLNDGGALCQRCVATDPARWKPCDLCGTKGRIVARIGGKAIGRCCYAHPVIRCTVCGLAKGVKPWKSRRPVCAACAALPRVPCVHCGKDAAVPAPGEEARCAVCTAVAVEACTRCGVLTAGRDHAGRPRCFDCYHRPVRTCGRCGRTRAIVRLAVGDDPELCAICWTGPTVVCDGCGKLRPCRGERRGRMLCYRCAPVAPQRCAHCGQERRVTAHWHEGPVCVACYHRALMRRATCPGCGETRRLMVYPGFEEKVCATCAGAEPFSFCSRCGTEDALYRRGLCPACALSDVLDELLGDESARAGNGLQPVFDRLVELDQPRLVLDWLKRERSSAQILVRIGSGELALEHRTFDELPASTGTWFVERLLVTAGALPARDPVLARMERWTADFLGAIDDVERRQLLLRFATWQILRPLRSKSAAEHLSDATHNGRKDVLKMANAFLEWLAADDRTLADCTQAVIEEWATRGPAGWHDAAGFVRWARQQHLVGALEFPKRPSGSPPELVADDLRWAVARRLLYEEGIDLQLRVAGLLVVLYAQTLARIVRLRCDDVERRDGHTELRLGGSPIRLPPPFDEHLLALASQRRTETVHQIAGGETWLFPGKMAGRPRHAGALGKQLVHLGVPSHGYRQAALAYLASTMPAAIVADLLGVSVRTATRWAKLTGRDWSDYFAHR